MKEFKYVITDSQGIHARPAGFLASKAKTFICDVQIGKDGKMVDAKHILGIMGLGIKFGQGITVTAEGKDEDTAIRALAAFLKTEL